MLEEMRKAVSIRGISPEILTRDKVYSVLSERLKALDSKVGREVSDIFSGLTACKVEGQFGHDLTYWRNGNNVVKEAFAQMFTATANNPESVNQIKRYFPKSYDLFLRMLKEIAGD